MSEVRLRKIVKRYDEVQAVRGIDLDIADHEFVVLVGPVGLRQVDDAAHDRGSRGHHRRRDLHRRRRGQRRAAERPRHRHGVPELRALSAHDGGAEHVVRAAPQDVSQGRDQEARGRGRPHPRHHGAARPQAQAALGRPAPARRHGPRHRAQSQGVPVRRAAVEPRRQAAGADAHRDQEGAPAGAHHHRLRHPRPDRGHDAGRSRGGHERRQHRAGRHAAAALSQPAHALRRRLHRLAGHELHSLPAGGGERSP